MTDPAAVVWQQLHWQRPLDPERVVGLLRHWAADQRSPKLVLETRSTADGTRNLLGGRPGSIRQAGRLLAQLLPGSLALPTDAVRRPVRTAVKVRASTRHRALRVADPLFPVRALAAALSQVRQSEELVVQLVLGPGSIPLAVATNSPSAIVAPWWDVVLHGNGKTVDRKSRRRCAPRLATTASPAPSGSVSPPRLQSAGAACCSACWPQSAPPNRPGCN